MKPLCSKVTWRDPRGPAGPDAGRRVRVHRPRRWRCSLVLAAAWLSVSCLSAELLPLPASSTSQASDPSTPAEQLSIHLKNQLESRWWKRQETFRRSGPAAAGRVGEDLLELMTTEEIRRIPEMADALVLEGRSERRLKNLTNARESFRFAHELDPLSAAAWRNAAAARYASGDGIGTIGRLAWNGLTARWSDYWDRYATLVNLIHLLATALLVTCAVVVFVVMLREAPTLVHLVDERLPSGWAPAWREAIGWLVVVAPVGLVFLGGWALLIWAAALVAVSGGRTRALLALCLAAVAVCVPAVRATSALASVSAEPAARVAVDTAQGAFRPGNLLLLQELERERPDEAVWKYFLARAVGLRDPDRSVALLREAVRLEPGGTDARVFLGNMFYRLGKFEKAGVVYIEVLDHDNKNVLALINLARVRLATFEFDESEELMQRARGVSEKRVRQTQRLTGDDEVADPEMALGPAARRVVAHEAAVALKESLRIVNPLSTAAIAFLFIGLIGSRWMARGVPRRCRHCGVAICSRCTPGDVDPDICRACDHLVSRRAGLAPSARAEQARRVEGFARRRRRSRRLVQLLWPGLALVHEGRLFLGLGLSAVWCFLLLALLRPDALLPAERSAGPGVGAAIVWGLLASVWLLAQTPLLRPQAEPLAGRG